MTIREQSKLSLVSYVFRITLPGSISTLTRSFEDAKPFFYNLMFVPILPVFVVVAAVHRRKQDRELVNKEDLKRFVKNAIV